MDELIKKVLRYKERCQSEYQTFQSSRGKSGAVDEAGTNSNINFDDSDSDDEGGIYRITRRVAW